MKACPNCGRATARTKDWACQWCGYPLLSGGYKTLPETYAELKGKEKREERLIPEPVFEVKHRPVAEPKLAPRPQPVVKVKPEPAPKPRAKVPPAPEPVAEVEPEPEPEAKEVAEPVSEAKVEPEAEVKPPPEPVVEAEPAPGAPLSVDYLYSKLEADKDATDARYKNQVIKIRGAVYRTVINENLTVAYVMLTSTRSYERQVTCAFDRKHEPKIMKLNEGESVTVQGTYDSYTATVLLMDCELI